MSNRAKDPFDFNDIYKQAGVEDLFVKKSMAQMKKPAGSVCATTTAVTNTASSGSNRAVTPETARVPKAPATNKGTAPAEEASPKAVWEARALQSNQRHEDMPAARQQNGHAGSDFDDMFGTKQPAAPVKATDADPFSAFEHIDGAGSPVHKRSAESTPSAVSAVNGVERGSFFETEATGYGAVPEAEDFGMPGADWTGEAAAAAADASTPVSRGAGGAAPVQRAAAVPATAPGEPAAGEPFSSRRAAPGPAARQDASQDTAPVTAYFATYGDGDAFAQERSASGQLNASGGWDAFGAPSRNSLRRRSSGAHSRNSSSSSWDTQAAKGTGLKGFFKRVEKGSAHLGKKAIRAAQAGLEQMNKALEHLEKGDADHETIMNSSSGAWHQQPASRESDGHSHPPIVSDDPVAIAVYVSEMSSSKCEEALAQLSPRMRMRVMHVLREQALAQDSVPSSTAPGPGPAPAPASRPVRRPVDVETQEFVIDAEEEGEGAGSMPPPAYHAAVRPAQTAATTAAPRPAVRREEPRVQAPDRPPAPVPPPPVAAVEEEDLLGMGSHASGAVHARGRDLMGDWDGSAAARGTSAAAAAVPAPAAAPAAAAPAAAGSAAHAAVPDVQDMGDFFGGGAAKPAGPAMTHSSSLGQLDAFFSSGKPAKAAAAFPHKPASMLDLSGLDGDAEALAMYGADDGTALAGDEPEARAQFRAQRIAAKHAKMKAALADKLSKEQAEEARREAQQRHKETSKAPIVAWKNKHKGNIRGLLGSLQTVLWPDSGWTPVGVGDLLEGAQVRKVYMKANLLVHPDKVRQRHGTDEQVAVADMVFDVLKEAWGQFKP